MRDESVAGRQKSFSLYGPTEQLRRGVLMSRLALASSIGPRRVGQSQKGKRRSVASIPFGRASRIVCSSQTLWGPRFPMQKSRKMAKVHCEGLSVLTSAVAIAETVLTHLIKASRRELGSREGSDREYAV